MAFGITGGQIVFALKAAGQAAYHERQWLGIGVCKEGMEGAMQGVRFRAFVGEEEELSHSPAEVDRDAHRCGRLGKVQLNQMEGAIREGREGWRCKRDGNGFQELSPGLLVERGGSRFGEAARLRLRVDLRKKG